MLQSWLTRFSAIFTPSAVRVRNAIHGLVQTEFRLVAA
jgi:hypothetical protein